MAKTTAKKKPAAKKNNKAPIAAVLIVAAIIGCIALVMNLGGLAKMTVEKVASRTLGASVDIASLDISLQEKQIKVTGLRIGNPQGYSQPYAATVETITIAAEDLKKDLLIFSEIKVSGTTLNLEVTDHGSNFTDLRAHAVSKASAKDQEQDAAKVIVRNLVIEQAILNPGVILAGTAPQPVTLPDIRIRGIGEESNGVLAAQAIAEVANYVVQVAMKTSMQQGFLRGMEEESLQNIQQQLGLSSTFMEQFRDLGDKVKDLFAN